MTSVLVWFTTSHFQKPPLPRLQTRPASFPPIVKEPLSEAAPEEELRWERTPGNIAEILRTDPRGTQREDRAPVWAFLRTGGGQHVQKEAAWLLGADEALSWLRGAEQAASEIEDGLAALALDGNLPAALREYALQHLGLWSEEHVAGSGVLSAFKQVFLMEQTSALAGVALTTLSRSCFGTSEAEWIQMQALPLAFSETAHPIARTAALQVLAQSGGREAESIARFFFFKAETVREKVSALEVLGKVGTSETLSWLAAISEATEPLMAAAQRQALEALKGRLRAAD